MKNGLAVPADPRNSLVVLQLRRCAFTAKGPGSIPHGRTKILQAQEENSLKKTPENSNQQALDLFTRIEDR